MNDDIKFAKLDSRALIAVRGEDWRTFLQGLITQDVLTLTDGEMRFSALLTPQGKFLFDMFVIGRADGCLLDVQAARREALIQRLKMYRLRAKVEIEAVEGEVWAAFEALPPRWGKGWDGGEPTGLDTKSRKGAEPNSAIPPDTGAFTPIPGPSPIRQREGSWCVDPRLPALGWRAIGAEPSAASIITTEDVYDAHRLTLGLPDPARDCIPDKTWPIEANFDLLNGIDFKKGCFVGQETTSRMKRRGQIKTRMLPVAFEGAPPPFGAEVLAGDLRAGEVLSGRAGAAMALLRVDRITGGDLSVDDRNVRVEFPRWFPQA